MIDQKRKDEIRILLEPVSPAMLRELLRECGCPLAPLVEGVRQEDLHTLERTLLGLAQIYEQGDPAERRLCRQAVIEAKDHARLVARNARVSAEARAGKEEMLLWMLTWLENPQVFETWVGLRKRALGILGAVQNSGTMD